jgi:hypothetical protein
MMSACNASLILVTICFGERGALAVDKTLECQRPFLCGASENSTLTIQIKAA